MDYRDSILVLPLCFHGAVCASVVLPWDFRAFLWCFHGAFMDCRDAFMLLPWGFRWAFIVRAWCFQVFSRAFIGLSWWCTERVSHQGGVVCYREQDNRLVEGNRLSLSGL